MHFCRVTDDILTFHDYLYRFVKLNVQGCKCISQAMDQQQHKEVQGLAQQESEVKPAPADHTYIYTYLYTHTGFKKYSMRKLAELYMILPHRFMKNRCPFGKTVVKASMRICDHDEREAGGACV